VRWPHSTGGIGIFKLPRERLHGSSSANANAAGLRIADGLEPRATNPWRIVGVEAGIFLGCQRHSPHLGRRVERLRRLVVVKLRGRLGLSSRRQQEHR